MTKLTRNGGLFYVIFAGMKSGFYNLEDLSGEKLKELFMECLFQSHHTVCESKYIRDSYRTMEDQFSIKEMLDVVSTKCHNVFVDRSVQHKGINDVGEAGFKIEHKDWYQISFFIRLDRFSIIAEKFKLTMN